MKLNYSRISRDFCLLFDLYILKRNLTCEIQFHEIFIDRLKELNDDKSKNGLSEDMIMAQGIGFFLAGFETR